MTDVSGASDKLSTDGPTTKAASAMQTAAKQLAASPDGKLTASQATSAAAALRASVDPAHLSLADFDDQGERLDPILSGAMNASIGIDGGSAHAGATDATTADQDDLAARGALVQTLQADAKGRAGDVDALQGNADAIADRMRASTDPAEQASLARQWGEANAGIEKLRKTLDREMELAALEQQLMFDNPSPATIKRLKALGMGKMVDRIIESWAAGARRKHGYVPPHAAAALAASGYAELVAGDLATHAARTTAARLDSIHWITLADGTVVPYTPSSDLDKQRVKDGKATGPTAPLPTGVAAPLASANAGVALLAGGAGATGAAGASAAGAR